MTKAQPLRVVIVGAGFAGLTAAIALGREGHRVVVLEKSRFNKETGAAINSAPNCTKMLEWLGVDVKGYGGTLLEEMSRYDHEGTLKYSQEFGPIRQSWQAEYYFIHRADLHTALKQQAEKVATIHTGCRIVTVGVSSDNPSVVLDDGQVFAADVLIGADGLHSVVRKQIAPSSSQPYPTDKACFRWLLPTSEISNLDETKDIIQPGRFIEWTSGKTRLVVYPCANNEVLNLCAFIPTAQVEAADASSKEIVMREFRDYCPAVQKLIESTDEDLKAWQLYDMDPLPRWVCRRAALIGDAAHPFQPFLGQGGAMAIEDGVSLATFLPLGTIPSEIPSLLGLYEKARRPRVEMALKYTRLNARDEDGSSDRRITAAEMMRFMGAIFSHDELVNSQTILQENLAGSGSNV
ncbi:hypothetical protein ASPVEDRAFT_196891 [Aspergillus versicolor CBS 583.65]|uniref:FAD-binding domain-containing protein n=1 Tax=Aspergillus versicolor CBS 583.65 TaxID=1036611 RepID=A0A1L9PSF9_ASPVE|nr:uncharacterized protein ASPVEDRAFT_196891 [Aspergillus versicolor CBS 583.65]OJJ04459.1 hypothetical protein ASPVEDRAFT_196891 [Aspergillus versicolor CBS 583.65]